MPVIDFPKLLLRSFKRTPKKGTATFSSELTKKIRKEMEWEECPASYDGGSPGGELVASKMVLSNHKQDLANYTYEIGINRAYDFKLIKHEIEGKRGKGHRFALEFKTDFVDIEGCKVLEEYITVAADSKGNLQVTYQPAARQVNLTPAEGDTAAQIQLVDLDEGDDEDEDEPEDEAGAE